MPVEFPDYISKFEPPKPDPKSSIDDVDPREQVKSDIRSAWIAVRQLLERQGIKVPRDVEFVFVEPVPGRSALPYLAKVPAKPEAFVIEINLAAELPETTDSGGIPVYT